MNETDKKFMEFIEKPRKTETGNRIHTIPEVFGIQYKEVYITKWLAYLLRQKDFGRMILNALIGSVTIKENCNYDVYTEYVFENGRRIDILIESQDFLIGIENKIWSGEQENQTSDYIKSMKEKSSDKECIGIYLHPEQNKSETNNFKNVTYTEFYDALTRIYFSESTGSFEKMMFEQFMIYVKECLYLNNEVYPEMSENAKIFSEYSDMIFSIEGIYNAEAEKMIDWIKNRFKKEGIISIGKPSNKTTYWKLVKDENWQKIGLHYELVWGGYLIKTGTLGLHMHREKVDGMIAQEIRDLFGLTDENERGVRNPLSKTDIICDFRTKQSAEDTINRIIAEIKGDRFKDYVKTASEYIKSHYAEKSD